MGIEWSFWQVVLLWVGRTALLAFVAAVLGWLGLNALDVLTPRIHERQRIGEDPIAIGLFVGGFMIMIGLVVHGVVTGPVLVGTGLIASIFDPIRLSLIAISFVVSLLIGAALLHIVDRVTPDIPFREMDRSPVAVGLYVFGYLIFFGLILNAALKVPL
ncbi:MAG TPA: DUF350 domain-containing protein [Dehalococcoidia bacterium]|nr:DUF350 domain-containing protein [Dehalococcoidia bacterium]